MGGGAKQAAGIKGRKLFRVVSLDCCNRIPQNGGLEQRIPIVLTVLKAGNPKSRFLWIWYQMTTPFQVAGSTLLIYSYGREREREL